MKKIFYLIFIFINSIFAIDFDKLISETQISDTDGDGTKLIWWIPDAFWIASFENEPYMPQSEVDEFMNIVNPYTILLVLDGEINQFGGFSFEDRNKMMRKIKIFDSYGNSYKPLSEYQINSDLQDFMAMMKPFFSNALGSLGENFQFFVFPSQNQYGGEIVNVNSNGFFKVQYDYIDYKFRLPLGALIPNKQCSTCYEKFSGNHFYCPWDGTKLK